MINSFIHHKDNRIIQRAIQSLTVFYKACESGDSCKDVRIQITKDYLDYIQSDTLVDFFDSSLSHLGNTLSIKEIIEANGRDIIVSIYRSKGLRAKGLASFILPLQIIEMKPELWKMYNKASITDNGGYTKSAYLIEILKLSDSTAMTIYKKTLWDYTKDTTKLIHERYFYALLENVKYLKDPELGKELFKMLEYLLVNPNKDKRIYITTFSDTDQPTYWFLGETIFYNIIPPSLANLPEKFYKYPYPKYNKENIKELLDWYKQNPNLVFK